MIYQPCFTHFPFSPEWPFHQFFYKPSLHSSLSASILAFYFTRKLKVLLGGCSDPLHQSLFFQASVFTYFACICSPKSVILRAWSQTSSIGGSGNLWEMQIHRSHYGTLHLNQPSGNSIAGASLTNTAQEKPMIPTKVNLLCIPFPLSYTKTLL